VPGAHEAGVGGDDPNGNGPLSTVSGAGGTGESLSTTPGLGRDDEPLPFLYRLDEPRWHTVVALTDWVIMHETTRGPFRPEDTESATWAPEEHDRDAVKAFLERFSL